MKRLTFYQLVITLIPLILVISVILSLVWYVNRSEKKTPVVAGEVELKEVVDSLIKLTEYVGPRGIDSEAGVQNLKSVLAMVKSTLGEENLQFKLSTSEGMTHDGKIWPVISADIAGEGKKVNLIVIEQLDEGSAMAFGLNFAEYIAATHDDEDRLRLVFYPPFEKIDEQKIWQSVKKNGEVLGEMIFLTTAEVDKVRANRAEGVMARRIRDQLPPDAILSDEAVVASGLPAESTILALPEGGSMQRRAGVLLEWMARLEKVLFLN